MSSRPEAPDPELLKQKIEAKYKAATVDSRYSVNKELVNPAAGTVALRTELSGDDVEVGNILAGWSEFMLRVTLFPFAKFFKHVDEDFKTRRVALERKGEAALVQVQSAEGREADLQSYLKMMMEKRAKEE